MEQDRASPVFLYQPELARTTLDQPRSHRQLDRRNDDPQRAQGARRTRPGPVRKGGVKVSDAEFAAIRIARDNFHGEWNYVISPNQ